MSGEKSAPEFSRIFDRRGLPGAAVMLEAQAEERDALAERFALVSIKSLMAEMTFEPVGENIRVKGMLEAEIVQSCAVSGDDLPVRISEPLSLVFVPASDLQSLPEEVELEEHELDEIAYEGTSFDLGEAIAQSLALAIDPFATGPDADIARRNTGLLDEESSGPLAAGLAALKGLRTD